MVKVVVLSLNGTNYNEWKSMMMYGKSSLESAISNKSNWIWFSFTKNIRVLSLRWKISYIKPERHFGKTNKIKNDGKVDESHNLKFIHNIWNIIDGQ
jgi:hypothetical protein